VRIQSDMTKLIVAFRNFVDSVSKKILFPKQTLSRSVFFFCRSVTLTRMEVD
jgi:hypothetical protein